MITQVTKRDKTLDNYNVEKIKVVIKWACEGLDINPLELEAKVTGLFNEGISTLDIQNNLINTAVSLITPSDIKSADWKYVAGRLHMMNIWKETSKERGFEYFLINEVKKEQVNSYPSTVKYLVEKGLYDKKILDIYSEEELRIVSGYINKKLDLDYDIAGARALSNKYLIKGELPQEAFMTIALLLASVEKKEERLKYAAEFYKVVSERKISLATPLLANLRKPNGSTSSCFTTELEDNIESIFDGYKDLALISKNGGGIGVLLSRLRAAGSYIQNIPNASKGVVSWIKIINDIAIAVDQLSKRSGAITVALDCWHLDMPDFLELQTEHGDMRSKAYDVFPQVVIYDEFMRRVINNNDWYLVDPHEVKDKLGFSLVDSFGSQFESLYSQVEQAISHGIIKLFKKVSAKSLFKDIMKAQLSRGLPYLMFKDTINKYNANQHEGLVNLINLCVESYSPTKADELVHCCNLCSINLANVGGREHEYVCKLAVRILDNGIDLTVPPIPEAKAHNEKFRTVGVGMMGLADWMAKRELSYSASVTSTAYPHEKVSNLFEDLAYWSIKASADLAVERGTYAAFEGSMWSEGKLIGKPVDWFTQNAKEPIRWKELSKQVQKTGIRNAIINAIAPNTSSSLVQGCTASFLPSFSKFFTDKHSKGADPIIPPFIKCSVWFYPEAKSVDPLRMVELVGDCIQPWIDTGISFELLFDLNKSKIDAKFMYDALILAWQKECKAIYYIRSIKKNENLVKDVEDCTFCAN